MHAAHEDDVGIGLGGLLGQSEAVAHKVGDVLQHAFGVVVCEDDGVLLLAHAADFALEVDALGDGLVDVSFLLPAGFDFCHDLVCLGWNGTAPLAQCPIACAKIVQIECNAK